MARGDDDKTAGNYVLELSMPEHEPEELRLGVESESGRKEAETSIPVSASWTRPHPSSGGSVGASRDCHVDVPVLGASKQREVTDDGPRHAALDSGSDEPLGTNTELPQAAADDDSEATVKLTDRELCRSEYPVVSKPSENGSRGDNYGVGSNEENKYISKIGEFEENTSESNGIIKQMSGDSRIHTNSQEELIDAISKLDISSPPDRELSPHSEELSPGEELSESSLESDGDTSDIDSDGPVYTNLLDESRLERRCNASRGKPYDRPARGTPDASPDATVTPEDDQDLKDFIQGSPELDQLLADIALVPLTNEASPSQSNDVNNLNGYGEMNNLTNCLTFDAPLYTRDSYIDEQATNTQPAQVCTSSHSDVLQASLACIPTVVDEKMNEDESAGKKPRATRRKKADTNRKSTASTVTLTSTATLTSAAMSTSNGGLELRQSDETYFQQDLHYNLNDVRNSDNVTCQMTPGHCSDSNQLNGGLHPQAYAPCHQLPSTLPTLLQQEPTSLSYFIPDSTPPQQHLPTQPHFSQVPGSINVMSSPQLQQNQKNQILNLLPRPQQGFQGMHLGNNCFALNNSMPFKQNWFQNKICTAGFLGGHSQPVTFPAVVWCPIQVLAPSNLAPAPSNLAPRAPSGFPIPDRRVSQRLIMPKPT